LYFYLGGSKKLKGKDYEHMVQRFNQRFMQDYFVYHQSDVPYFAMNTAKTRPFKPQHLPDFLYLHRTKPQYLLECKYTNSDRFVFDRCKGKQLKILELFNQFVGISFILLGFREGKYNYLLNLKNYYKLKNIRESEGKKSINERLNYDLLKNHSIQVNRVKLRTNYYLDLSYLLRS
jgi:penicillin-binding protein-related factor A (putative recombinase)